MKLLKLIFLTISLSFAHTRAMESQQSMSLAQQVQEYRKTEAIKYTTRQPIGLLHMPQLVRKTIADHLQNLKDLSSVSKTCKTLKFFYQPQYHKLQGTKAEVESQLVDIIKNRNKKNIHTPMMIDLFNLRWKKLPKHLEQISSNIHTLKLYRSCIKEVWQEQYQQIKDLCCAIHFSNIEVLPVQGIEKLKQSNPNLNIILEDPLVVKNIEDDMLYTTLLHAP